MSVFDGMIFDYVSALESESDLLSSSIGSSGSTKTHLEAQITLKAHTIPHSIINYS